VPRRCRIHDKARAIHTTEIGLPRSAARILFPGPIPVGRRYFGVGAVGYHTNEYFGLVCLGITQVPRCSHRGREDIEFVTFAPPENEHRDFVVEPDAPGGQLSVRNVRPLIDELAALPHGRVATAGDRSFRSAAAGTCVSPAARIVRT
jgi:hypothetical protein